jgi:Fe-S-cluster containining protein
MHIASELVKITSPGKERARLIYETVDSQRIIFKSANPELANLVQCRKGCAECCYVHVTVTDDEAELLSSKVISGEVKIDEELLFKQIKHMEFSEESGSWKDRKNKSLSRCIFLSTDNSCSVYSDRPAMCRNYEALEHPSKCDITSENPVRIMFIPDAEMVGSAALNVGECDSMAKMIHKKLEKKAFKFNTE